MLDDLPEDWRRPRLRPVDLVPLEIDGAESLGIKDPTGITEEILVLGETGLFLAGLMDGSRTFEEIQMEYTRKYGDLLRSEELREVIGAFEKSGFLKGERSNGMSIEAERSFSKREIREPWGAGRNYPAESMELDAYIEETVGSRIRSEIEGDGRRLTGLLIPHVDFKRGGEGYARALEAMADGWEGVETVIVLGTCHGPFDAPMIMTRKDFSTPFGTVETDRAAIDTILSAAGGGFDPFEEEFAHRAEHSIEIQAVLMRYLMGDNCPRIVPILLTDAAVDSGYSLASALGEYIGAGDGNVVLLASADLAHLGPHFGDPEPVRPHETPGIKAEDGELIDLIIGMKPDLFAGKVLEGDNRRRICGLAPLHLFLSALPGGLEGRLLHYGLAWDPRGTVTFATIAFSEKT